MNLPRLAVLGEALIDFKATGPLAFQGYPGGSPFNVSIAIARLAQPVTFLSQISRDLLGEPLMRYLADNAVDTRYVLPTDAPTTVAFVEERDGQAHFQFFNNGSADTLYDPQPRPALPESVRFMHFGSISLLKNPTSSSIVEIVRAHCERALVHFDPNCRPHITPDAAAYRRDLHERWAPLAHVLKISDQDLAWLEPGRAHADVAAAWLKIGPQAVIVTAGEKGATVFRHGAAPVQVTPPHISVVDTVGAGDTFSGALLARLSELSIETPAALAALNDDAWRGLLSFAAEAAAINCTRAGANPPRRTELSTPMPPRA